MAHFDGLDQAIGEVTGQGLGFLLDWGYPRYSVRDLPKAPPKPKKRKGGPQDRASYWREKLRRELPG